MLDSDWRRMCLDYVQVLESDIEPKEYTIMLTRQNIKSSWSNRDGKIEFSGKYPPSCPRGVPTTKHGRSIRALPNRNLRTRKPSKLCMKSIRSWIQGTEVTYIGWVAECEAHFWWPTQVFSAEIYQSLIYFQKTDHLNWKTETRGIFFEKILKMMSGQQYFNP